MMLIQLVKETRLLLAEARKFAEYISKRKDKKSEKPSQTASN